MNRAKERFFIFNIKEGDRGNDTEAFIKSALDHEQIIKWAYVLHDKETYNQQDMNCRYYGAQYCWADGFPGMEKYSSKQEYLDEQMKEPPFIGDKKEAYWHIFIIADKSVYDEDISDWFGMPGVHYLRVLTNPSSIKDALESLTNEDHTSIAMERYRYPDDAVKADFDFREYMERLKVNRKLERWKDILKPAPFKIRRRPEK